MGFHHLKILLVNIFFLLAFHFSGASEFIAGNPFRTDVFIENKGQFNGWSMTKNQVLFGIDKMDQVQFTSSEIIYHLRKIEPKKRNGEREKEGEEEDEEEKSAKITDSWVKARWINSNPNVTVEPLDEQQGRFTYCLYNKNVSILSGVSAAGFRKLIYKELYPGIDVELIISEKGGFKYSLHCKPGADISQVKLAYEGNIKSITEENGEVIIKTPSGIITEHRPESFYRNGKSLSTEFKLNKNSLSFIFPDGINSSEEIIVDPWVTSNLSNLSSANEGYDIDLDYQGNLYVYGGGDPSGSGMTEYKVAKYDQGGTLLWTFNGAVPSAFWSSVGDMYRCPSNFLIEKTTGRCYVGQTFTTTGTQVIRLDPNGNYDNFISNTNSVMLEIWDMAFNCTNGQIYACGGGMSTNNNFGIIDPVNGAVTTSNITGYPGGHQDIVTVAMDNNGVMFASLASIAVFQVHNYLFKVNSTFNGNLWNAPTGFYNLTEPNNKRYLNSSGVTGNGSNVVGVNDSYLFFYDGYNLAAYNKNSGAQVGSSIIVNSGYSPMYQSGIAADNCNNVYVGGTGLIHSYKFNGSTFTPTGNISLNASIGQAAVHDIKYDWNSNSLYVCGNGFAGIYSANQSTLCNNLDLTVTSNCSDGAMVSVSTSLMGGLLTYTWTDSAGTILSSRTTTDLSDSLQGLADGTYYIRVQVSPLCGGPIAMDTVHIFSTSPIQPGITSTDPGCSGFPSGNATVLLNDTSGIHFAWSTIPVQTGQTAVDLYAGYYVCQITDADGCASTISVLLNDPPLLTCSVSGGTTVCPGSTVTLSVSGSGGTGNYHYSWDDGSSTNQITVNPRSPSNFSCVITDDNGCTNSSFASVDIHPLPVADGGPDTSNCSGETNILGLPGLPGFTYEWYPQTGLFAPYSAQTQVVAVNYSSTRIEKVFNLIVTDQNGCRDTDIVSLFVKPVPNASFTPPGKKCLNGDGFIFVPHSSVNGSINYTWNFGADATPQSSSATFPPPVHYSAIGSHLVTLQAESDGCAGPLYADSVRLFESPVAEFQNDISEGCAPLTVNFGNMSSQNSNGYFWNFGDGSVSDDPQPVHTYTTSGLYSISLSAVTRDGCVNLVKKEKLVNVYANPVAGFTYTPGIASVLSPAFSFYNSSIDAKTYSWDFGDGSTSDKFEEWHQYEDTGTYIVRLAVVSDHGCPDTVESVLRIEANFTFYIPNAFTPNGDNDNDAFQGYGTYIKSYEMIIMNRWGEELYHTTDYDKPWDGRVDSPVQNEVYIYKFNVSDVFDHNYTYIGSVTLIR